MDFHKFISLTVNNDFKPVYLFTGKEDFLVETGIRELIARLLTPEEKDLNLTVFAAKESDAIARSLSTPPMFAARRVILIKQAGDLAGPILDEVESYVRKPPLDACLILWAGDVDKRKSFYKKIDPLIDAVICNSLKIPEMQLWIAEYAGRFGKKLDSEAIDRLCAVNWPGLRELAGEIDRLTLMIGEKSVITAADIEELGGASFGFERWRLSDAVGAIDRTNASAAVRNLLDWGIKPNQIVGDLFKVLRQLWFIRWHIDHKKVAEAKVKLGLKDFIFNKLQRQAGAIPLNNLEEALLRVLEAELDIKQGTMRNDDLVAITVVSDVLTDLSSSKRQRGAA